MNSISVNYAEALFLLAKDENTISTYYEQLNDIIAVYKESNDLKVFLDHPKISQKEKRDMIDKVFSDMETTIKNFIKLLIDKRRSNLLLNIFKDFNVLYNIENNIQEATVYSAIELDDKQKESIKKVLEERTKSTIDMNCFIDESIIGGIKVKLNDEVLDNSISRKLEKLKHSIENSTTN